MQKMPPVIFTGTVFGLLQSFGLDFQYTRNCPILRANIQPKEY